jgi:threonine-phosphate decarboxylase
MEIRHGGIDYLMSAVHRNAGGTADGNDALNGVPDNGPGDGPDGTPSGGRIVDFSVNVSPLGMPEACAGAIRAVDYSRYPDPFCRRLRAALSEYLGVAAEQIVCGNGAGDLIYRISRWKNPSRALVAVPTFSDYEKSLREISCEIVRYELSKESFELDRNILSKISADIQIMFLCNPNNPTGLTINAELLDLIIKKCGSLGVTLVIDECFNEFLDDPAAHTAVPYLKESPNLIIIRAFTKIFAMAGLRLGYCVTSGTEEADAIGNIGQAWPVSAAAQAAGIAALADKDYCNRVRSFVGCERARMKNEFRRLGLDVIGGEANFIFFRLSPDFDKNTFFDSLLRNNILSRSCDNYYGLDNSYYRTAVLGREENNLLLKVLQKMKGG